MEESDVECEECGKPIQEGEKVLKISQEIHPNDLEQVIFVHATCYSEYIKKQCEQYHDNMVKDVLLF